MATASEEQHLNSNVAGAPLLGGRRQTGQHGPSGLVKRVMQRHWPNPTTTLLALLAAFGCLQLAEKAVRPAHREPPPSLEEAPILSAAPYGTDVGVIGSYALVLALASVAALLVCHLAFEALLSRAVARAVLDLKPGFAVTTGGIRASVLAGSLELRNCIIQNPPGYASRHLARVRVVAISLNLWKLLRTLGHEIEISSLVIDGVRIVVESHVRATGIEERSNVSEVMDTIRATAGKGGPSVEHVEVKDIEAVVVGGQAGHAITDITYERFSNTTQATGAAAAASLVESLGRAVLSAL